SLLLRARTSTAETAYHKCEEKRRNPAHPYRNSLLRLQPREWCVNPSGPPELFTKLQDDPGLTIAKPEGLVIQRPPNYHAEPWLRPSPPVSSGFRTRNLSMRWSTPDLPVCRRLCGYQT